MKFGWSLLLATFTSINGNCTCYWFMFSLASDDGPAYQIPSIAETGIDA